MSDAPALRSLPAPGQQSPPGRAPGDAEPDSWVAAPLSLQRTRLLLNWLRAQRAVDQYLSELLAAGPAGERRVGGAIEHVDELVAEATAAFEAYRESVGGSAAAMPDDPPAVVTLADHRPSAGAVSRP